MTPSELPDTDPVRLPDLRRLLYEELPAEEAAALRARVEAHPRSAARLRQLEAEQAAFMAEARPEIESAAILARLEAAPKAPATSWWARLRGPWVPALAAAAVLFAVAPRLLMPDPVAPTTREKGGGVGLVMFVKDGAGVRRGGDGERLREGDQIQFRYAADGHRHLFVVSVDARGVLSPLYPEDPTRSIEVAREGSHVLEGSVILDDAVGPERIFAVFSDAPVEFGELDAAVRAAMKDVPDVTGLSALPLGRDDVAQSTVLIVKE